MVVIDEQHRFGVHQRLTLTGKGTAVAVLVMTATPIPRTLMLTAYGDTPVSRLTARPPGRPPTDTRTLDLARLDEPVAATASALSQRPPVHLICPPGDDARHSHTDSPHTPRTPLTPQLD